MFVCLIVFVSLFTCLVDGSFVCVFSWLPVCLLVRFDCVCAYVFVCIRFLLLGWLHVYMRVCLLAGLGVCVCTKLVCLCA